MQHSLHTRALVLSWIVVDGLLAVSMALATTAWVQVFALDGATVSLIIGCVTALTTVVAAVIGAWAAVRVALIGATSRERERVGELDRLRQQLHELQGHVGSGEVAAGDLDTVEGNQ